MWRLMKLLVIPVPLAAAFFLFTEHQKHVARQQALGGAELSMFEFAKGQYASMVNASAQAALKPVDVQTVMPAAPEGWTRETFVTEHGAKITRAAFDPSAPVTTTDAALQTDFLSAAGQHHNMAAMSYINGNKVFALRMRPLPNSEETDLAAAASDGLSSPVVTKLGEVPMHLLPQMSHDLTTVSYTHLTLPTIYSV